MSPFRDTEMNMLLPLTERLRVVFEQLMVCEFLPRHFLFRHTQKCDQRAALRVAVARR